MAQKQGFSSDPDPDMIINQYLLRNIVIGSLLALLVLISLSLFFTFVRELEELGEGRYGVLQLVEYLALIVPGTVVQFMPLAVLLGCMLSLGGLASNSEIIALQASGVSLPRILGSILQAGFILALVNFVVADQLVPVSETSARQLKNQAQEKTKALRSQKGLWIKDENRILHLNSVLPNGIARDVEIFELDSSGKLQLTTRAESAIPVDGGWQLQQVLQTAITENGSSSRDYDQLFYAGNLSQDLLQVLMIEPRQMSSRDLHSYINFLQENRLDGDVERLIFWQKMFAPLSILVMCLLAFPFILGPQRQANTGYRLMIGILLGLSFVVVERLLVQLGTQFQINAMLIAILPSILFLLLAAFLLRKTQSHGLLASLRFGSGRL